MFNLVEFIITRLSGSNEQEQLSFMSTWLETHFQDAQYMLQKPLLVTEFGKSWKDSGFRSDERDALFNNVYFKIYSSAKHGGPAAGGLFWQLLVEGMDSFRDGYDIILSQTPSTANIIAQQSRKLHLIQKIFARMWNMDRWKRTRAAAARDKGRKRIGN